MSSAARTLALLRKDAKYTTRMPVPVLLYLVIPLALMAFLREGMRQFVSALGYPHSNGSEFIVPGQLLLFSFMFTEHIGLFLYSEHSWGVWDRVRATKASLGEIMTAKFLDWLLHMVVFSTVLLTAGGLLFSLPAPSSWPGLVLLMLGLVLCAVGYGFCGFAISPSNAVFDAWTYVGTLVLTSLGGGLVPAEVLPSWARRIAPASPMYWFMQGSKHLYLERRGLAAMAAPVGVLMTFGLAFGLIGAWRFDPHDRKLGRAR